MRRARNPSSVILLGIAAVLVLAPAQRADAHAVLLAADPADGAVLDAAPSVAVLTLSEPIESKVSSVRVLSADGKNVTAGKASAVRGDAKKLSVRLTELDRGTYVVTWRVLSRVDGHVTGGTLAFGVGVNPGVTPRISPGVSQTPGATPLTAGSRFLFYAGVMMLLGMAWVSALALRGEASRLLLFAGWVSALLGVVGLAESQLRETGASLGDLWGTAIGNAFIWRAGPLFVALVAIVVVRRAPVAGLVVVGGAALVAIVGHVAFGHAAAGSFTVGKVAVQSIHFAAVGVWIGGLTALLRGIRRIDADRRAYAIRRFSQAAGVALLLVAVSGTVRAVNETGSWRALTGTGYGRLILAKASLLVVIAGLGAVNRYRHVPHAQQEVAGLRRFSTIEIGVAVGVLALTGVLASIAPGRNAALAKTETKPRSLVVDGADFATSVRARLEVSPAKPGPNRFAVRLTDYDTGQPVPARRVSLTFTYRGRTDIQASTLELTSGRKGTYTGQGGNLGLGGPWKIRVLVEREADSVEVPLTLATLSDQPVETIKTPGQPTLYNVTLATGGSVQFYVDPPRAGQAEVHATFFDAQGGEVQGLRDISLVASGPTGEPRSFPVRVLSPGHFVADASLVTGGWRFDVTATSPTGDLLWAYFEEIIRS